MKDASLEKQSKLAFEYSTNLVTAKQRTSS